MARERLSLTWQALLSHLGWIQKQAIIAREHWSDPTKRYQLHYYTLIFSPSLGTQTIIKFPPPTASTCPLTQPAWSLAKNATTPATSSIPPIRGCTGVSFDFSAQYTFLASGNPLHRSVSIIPKASAFTVNPPYSWPSSFAHVRVILSRAALLAEYAVVFARPRWDPSEVILMMRPVPDLLK